MLALLFRRKAVEMHSSSVSAGRDLVGHMDLGTEPPVVFLT